MMKHASNLQTVVNLIKTRPDKSAPGVIAMANKIPQIVRNSKFRWIFRVFIVSRLDQTSMNFCISIKNVRKMKILQYCRKFTEISQQKSLPTAYARGQTPATYIELTKQLEAADEPIKRFFAEYFPGRVNFKSFLFSLFSDHEPTHDVITTYFIIYEITTSFNILNPFEMTELSLWHVNVVMTTEIHRLIPETPTPTPRIPKWPQVIFHRKLLENSLESSWKFLTPQVEVWAGVLPPQTPLVWYKTCSVYNSRTNPQLHQL